MMLSFAVLVVSALAIFLIFSMHFTKNAVLENAGQYTSRLVNQMNVDIDSYINYMENISQMVTESSDASKFLWDVGGSYWSGSRKAAKEQLTVAQVYMQVAKALTGSADLIELSDGGDTYAVSVQTAGKDKITPEYVRSLTFDVTGKDGTVHSVALRDIATVEETESLSSIRRLNQRRYIDVTADIAEGYNVTLVTDAAEEALASFSPSDGTTIGFTGERESIVEALRQLVLMLAVGILLVYLVMVAQFQDLKSPFIVMFTIPLAFTGGFLALLIAGLEINLLSMLGMIMLVGIIVNNGIVLVDYINQLRIGGMDRREAIADAAVTRLRPILMTSITTILGLIVMALGQSEATSLIQPLAVTCIGGLLYATLMTLYVVPVMYDALSKKALYHVDEADLQLSEK